MTESEANEKPMTPRYPDNVTFTVTCTMRARWVPHFLGMLAHMQRLGNWGSTRQVTFVADGDGDFRPRFVWPDDMPKPAGGQGSEGTFFDAG